MRNTIEFEIRESSFALLGEMKFYDRDRVTPIGIMVYSILSGDKVFIQKFWTVNWVTHWEEWSFPLLGLKKNLDVDKTRDNKYTWLWTECLRIYIQKMSEKGMRQIQFRSVPWAIGFYRKVLDRILASWEIRNWKQGYWEWVKWIPISFFKYSILDFIPFDKFTITLNQKL